MLPEEIEEFPKIIDSKNELRPTHREVEENLQILNKHNCKLIAMYHSFKDRLDKLGVK